MIWSYCWFVINHRGLVLRCFIFWIIRVITKCWCANNYRNKINSFFLPKHLRTLNIIKINFTFSYQQLVFCLVLAYHLHVFLLRKSSWWWRKLSKMLRRSISLWIFRKFKPQWHLPNFISYFFLFSFEWFSWMYGDFGDHLPTF